MKKLIRASVVALSAVTPLAVFAQFSMPSLPGLGKSSGSAPADLSGQQNALVKNFIAANVDVLRANAKMSEALGLKGKADDAEAVAQQLSSGSTVDKDSASKASTAVGDTSGAIQQKLAEKPTLDAAAKATYAQGLGNLATGVIKYTALGKDVKSMGDSIKGASPMQMATLGAAGYVVTNFPTSAGNLTKTLKSAIDFARSNGIEVPDDATKALSSL